MRLSCFRTIRWRAAGSSRSTRRRRTSTRRTTNSTSSRSGLTTRRRQASSATSATSRSARANWTRRPRRTSCRRSTCHRASCPIPRTGSTRISAGGGRLPTPPWPGRCRWRFRAPGCVSWGTPRTGTSGRRNASAASWTSAARSPPCCRTGRAGPEKTSKYVLDEWRLAAERGLPCLVIPHPETELRAETRELGGLVAHTDDTGQLSGYAENLAEEWATPRRAPYIVYATELGKREFHQRAPAWALAPARSE